MLSFCFIIICVLNCIHFFPLYLFQFLLFLMVYLSLWYYYFFFLLPSSRLLFTSFCGLRISVLHSCTFSLSCLLRERLFHLIFLKIMENYLLDSVSWSMFFICFLLMCLSFLGTEGHLWPRRRVRERSWRCHKSGHKLTFLFLPQG